MLWDNRSICGPSLTETSLCGAYLYLNPSDLINVHTEFKWLFSEHGYSSRQYLTPKKRYYRHLFVGKDAEHFKMKVKRSW